MAEQVVTQSISVWVPVVAALGSSFLTGCVAIFINYLNKKSELEKIKTQAMINAGVEFWKTHVEIAKLKPGSSIPPMSSYVLHMHKVSEIMFDPKTTKENINSRLSSATDLMKEMDKFWENQTSTQQNK